MTLTAIRDPRLLSVLAAAAACGAARLLGVELPALEAFGTGIVLLGAFGHCDSLDGPVVQAARKALESGNVNRVLPWVQPEAEPAVREAFGRALAERAAGPAACQAADLRFFEAVVRMHRAGEGEAFGGLRPAGYDPGAGVRATDRALETGDFAPLVELLARAVRNGLRQRFQAAWEHRRFDVNDVAEGRRYVDAYVPLINYVEAVEALWKDVTVGAPHRATPASAAEPRVH